MSHELKNSLPGPENILRTVLPNGITLLVRENPYSATAALKGTIPCGAYLETSGKLGLTGFLTGCLTAGTAFRSFEEIHSLLEVSGASLGFNVGSRSIGFSGSCLAEDLAMLLGLLKEILDEPVFPEEHIEIFRHRALTAYELHLHDPESMTDERFDALLYGDHPYGRPEYGSAEIIRGITRRDLTEYHSKYFGPKGMIISIAGGIKARGVSDLCEKIFGSWEKKQEIVRIESYFPPVKPPKEAISEHTEIPDKSELSLVMGTLGPKRTDPDYMSAVLGNSILGEFGMMGRLGRTVRDENGLAYYVSSSLDSLHYGGCWSVEAGVNLENLEKAAGLIHSELKRFTGEKVTEEELDDVRSSYIGGLPLALESNGGVAGLLMNMETYNLGLDHLIRMPERVDAVTPEMILETARKWLDPDKLIRVTAGTTSVIKNQKGKR